MWQNRLSNNWSLVSEWVHHINYRNKLLCCYIDYITKTRVLREGVRESLVKYKFLIPDSSFAIKKKSDFSLWYICVWETGYLFLLLKSRSLSFVFHISYGIICLPWGKLEFFGSRICGNHCFLHILSYIAADCIRHPIIDALA